MGGTPPRSILGREACQKVLDCRRIGFTTINPMRHLLFLLVLALAAGCGVQEEADEPGVRGPVVFRLWDRQARAQSLPPTVIRADAVHQAGADFDDLTMVPVLVRRPLADGVVWIHAPSGRFQAEQRAAVKGASSSGPRDQEIALEGPVHLTGMIRGLPITGSAATAVVPRGREVLELTDLRLVRGGTLMTAPKAELADRTLTASGPVSIAPGSPAMTAVLGALP